MKKVMVLLALMLPMLLAGYLILILPPTNKQVVPAIEFEVEGSDSALDGDRLVVLDTKSLKIFDLTKKTTIKEILIPRKYSVRGFDFFGDLLVWSDLRNETTDSSVLQANADIFMYNVSTGEQKQLTTDTSAQLSPKIWEHYVVYQDNRNDLNKEYPGRWSLYLLDLNTGEEKLISPTLAPTGTFNIKDNKVVWADERNFRGNNNLRGGGNVPGYNTDIYLFDIVTSTEVPITSGPLMESQPDVSGDYVVWADRNNGTLNADIMLYNLKTGKTRYITRHKANQDTPRIFQDYVVWMDERRGISSNDVFINGKPPNSDIFLYNLKTGKELRLTGDEPQISPYITSNWVAFTLSRQIGGKIQVVKY